MSRLQAITIVAIAVEVPLQSYLYRFQRTTHGLCTENFGKVTAELQSQFTPTWLGILGWADSLLRLAIAALVFTTFGWVWALLWLGFAFSGVVLIDLISPLPTYTHCMNVIGKNLLNDGRRAVRRYDTNEVERINQLVKVLELSRERHRV